MSGQLEAFRERCTNAIVATFATFAALASGADSTRFTLACPAALSLLNMTYEEGPARTKAFGAGLSSRRCARLRGRSEFANQFCGGPLCDVPRVWRRESEDNGRNNELVFMRLALVG
jgi:hypothetical protein